MKTYLYYATEENCFETEKFSTENPLSDIKTFLTDSFIKEGRAETLAKKAVKEFEQNGYALIEIVDGQDYNIVIGIARFGKCSNVTSVIKENRAEAIALC